MMNADVYYIKIHIDDPQCIFQFTHLLTPYKSVSKSFLTGCLEQELQMVQLSATRHSCNTIL